MTDTMIFLELLQKHCAHFPLISPNELETLKAQLPSLITSAKRSSQIPLAQKTAQNQELTLLLPTLLQFAQLNSENKTIHLADILLSDAFNQTQSLMLSNAMNWKTIFKTFLFLENLDANLAFIKHYDSLFFHPSQFSGLILALLELGYDKKIIIECGIMQKFFKFHIACIEQIESTYLILESQNHQADIKAFLELAKQTFCGMDVFATLNILGKELPNKSPMQSVEVANIEHNVLLSHLQFKNLCNWLGADFLVIFLSKNTAHSEEFLDLLSQWVVERPNDEMKTLYQNIFYSMPEYPRFKVFKTLGKMLSKPHIEEFINKPSTWFWIVLACAPQEKLQMQKKQLLEHCLQQPIETKDILYVSELCFRAKFKTLHEHFYQNIFELFVKKPDVDLDVTVFNALNSYPKTKLWVLKLAKKLQDKLSQTIQSNLDNFDHNKFLNIRDVFLTQAKIYQKLQLFELDIENYPEDHYQLTAQVLSYLYLNQKNPDAFSWAFQMLPGRLLDEEQAPEALNIIQRTLKEWIVHTHSYEMMMYACVVLKQRFQFNMHQLENSLPSKLSLSQIALFNSVCLYRYTELFPTDTPLDIFTYASQKDAEPLIIKLLSYPRILLNLFKNLTPDDCFKILNFKYKNQATVFIQLFNQPRLIGFCLSILTPQQRHQLFNYIYPIDESNIYYLAAEFPKTLQVLFPYFNYQDFLAGIQKTTIVHNTAFEVAFENPESFALLINQLEIPDLMKLCQMTSHKTSEPHLFEIFKQAGLLHFLLERLPAPSIYQVFNDNQSSLINIIIHKPQAWRMILSKLPGEIAFNLLASNGLIHQISKYPTSLEAVLKQIPEPLRLNLLKLKNYKQQSVLACLNKPIYPILSMIIDNIPASQLKAFAQLPYHEPRIILDLLVSQMGLFHQFYEQLPKEEQLAFLFQKTSNQQRVIDLISLNDTQLIQEMFSNLNEEAIYQLIISDNAYLLIKSLHHPSTLEYFLQFVDKIELPELLFSQQENFCPTLSKITDTQSVVILIKSALSIDHQSILMHKHQQAGSILQFCINEPNHLVNIVSQCYGETLEWICQKISAQALSCRPLLEKPTLLAKFLQSLAEPQKKQCLQAICLQYPQFVLSVKLKNIISDVMFSKIKEPNFFQGKQQHVYVHPKLKQCHVLADVLELNPSPNMQKDKNSMMKL